jgi:uncharacterized protein YbbK (DUF523 family)/uncharacterized protein YbgA (DUF1722 family)
VRPARGEVPGSISARRRAGWIRIGISGCLLGERVRWDGGHKLEAALIGWEDSGIEWVPVCPEVEAGMGVPREPVRLTGSLSSPRMVGVRSRADWTDRMERYAASWVRRAERLEISGYILKSDSPSCGMEGVPVLPKHGRTIRGGRGLFARALVEGMPLLPLEEESRLRDATRREHFLERVLAFRRWRIWRAGGRSRRDCAAFHSAHELQILSHSPGHCRALQRLAISAGRPAAQRLADRYGVLFLRALRIPATVPGHLRAFRRLAKLVQGRIAPQESRRLRDLLDGYRRGAVPRAVPLELFRRRLAHVEFRDLRNQVYLFPDSREWILWNRARIW